MRKIFTAHLVGFIAIIIASCSFAKKSVTPSVVIKDSVANRPISDTFFTRLFRQYPGLFDSTVRPEKGFQVQIIYTQVDRDAANNPSFTHHFYQLNPNQYFYPASTVKMPAAFLALQRLNELNIPGLDRNSLMITGAADKSQTAVYNDPTTADGSPSIAHYIKKIFLVSDNDAHNRLYEFLGQTYFNQTLHRMGYDSVQLFHRLSVPMNDAQNRLTNPIVFYDTTGKLLYSKPAEASTFSFAPRSTQMGVGYMSKGKLIQQPFDFSTKNRFPLSDLHSMLMSVIFPDAVPKKQRFQLTDDDYRFLYRYMSMMPKESDYPQYDTTHYTDAYVKFILFGGDGPIRDPNIRIFNKVGDAYGFLTDVAYVVDFANGVEFFLSATIYCNSDGIFNDDKYDYDTIGFPFFRNLGRVIYAHEKRRERKHKPDLSKFRDALK